MVRALLSVVTALGLLVMLAAATSSVGVQNRARAVHREAAHWIPCHSASWIDAFSPDTAKAGYLDQRFLAQVQFANKVCKNQ